MKILLSILLAFSLNSSVFAEQKIETTKKVCIDRIKNGKPVVDKNGKPQQDCKEVKQHKKLEGTNIKDAKK